MLPVAGLNAWQYGAKDRSVSVVLSTGCGSGCLSLCLAWTQIMGVSSLTTTSITTVGVRGSPSPALAHIRRILPRKDCHVEQKNWSVVRRLIGYDRYNSKAALETLNRVYELTRLYVNFFQPVMKLVNKARHGAKVHKVYNAAQTSYQRLLKAGVLTEAKQQELAATYHRLNPVTLLQDKSIHYLRLPPTYSAQNQTHIISNVNVLQYI